MDVDDLVEPHARLAHPGQPRQRAGIQPEGRGQQHIHHQPPVVERPIEPEPGVEQHLADLLPVVGDLISPSQVLAPDVHFGVAELIFETGVRELFEGSDRRSALLRADRRFGPLSAQAAVLVFLAATAWTALVAADLLFDRRASSGTRQPCHPARTNDPPGIC